MSNHDRGWPDHGRPAGTRDRPGDEAPASRMRAIPAIGGSAAASRAEPAAKRPPLRAREVIASAARAGWGNAGLILLVAIAVSTTTTAAEMTVHGLVDATNVPVTIAADLAVSGISLLGVVFLAGFLSQLVGEAGHGRPRLSIRDLLRKLSWRRLILTDLLVVLLVVVGLIALVIPGLIAINLFAVAGPVVEIENRPVLAALRRSARLVRQHFWKVALLATLPVTVADDITSAAPHPTDLGSGLTALAIRGVAGGVIEAALGLLLAELFYRLIELDRQASQAASRETGPTTSRETGPTTSRETGRGADASRPERR
jgi:hypothetical protein